MINTNKTIGCGASSSSSSGALAVRVGAGASSILAISMFLLFLMLRNPQHDFVSSNNNNNDNDNHNRDSSKMVVNIPTKEIAPGVNMPVMSIGTGGLEHIKAYEIVTNWLEIGGRGIDTALNYNNQAQVAKAIQDFANKKKQKIRRQDLFLITKIPDCNVSSIEQYIQADLRLLQTSYIDLLLIHSPRRGNCGEAWKILQKYFKANKTRAIGVSNFGPSDLLPILNQNYENDTETIIPHVNQIKVHLLYHNEETIHFCQEHNIMVESWSPLAQGQVAHTKEVQTIAQKHNVSAYQVAVKWILQHQWILTFQSSSKQHQWDDANVFDKRFVLTDHEMTLLDNLQHQHRHLA